MKKVIVRMRGGLGNQMFIIAFAYSIIQKLNFIDYEIVLDNREYKNYKIRKFEILDLINDDKIRIYDKKKDKDIFYDISRKCYHVIQKFLPNNMPILNFLARRGMIYSKRSAELELLPKKNNRLYIYGYFQDENMVRNVRKLILDKIDKNYLKSKGNLQEKKNIAISIRCGQDYIKQKWPMCSDKYYNQAIDEIINKKYIDENFNILIFSDDIQKAKKMKLYDNAYYIENFSATEQLMLMIQCDDFIISNSSFSWWGAYLGKKNDSMIIAPNLWYPTGEPTNKTLIYFKNMIIKNK